MKLEKILDKLGSIEKNSFIKVINNIIDDKPKNIKEIDKILSSSDRGLKSIDSQNTSKIFSLVKDEVLEYLKQEFQNTSSQLDILIDIIIRDGNCIMKQDWFSRLYEKEIKSIRAKTKILKSSLENDKSDLSYQRKRDYKIYKSCLNTAYYNDKANNRDEKVTDDELSIMLTLASELGLSQEEVKLINYSIIPIKRLDIIDVINNLKNIGVIFYSKKENTVYVADEMIRLLRRLRQKEVADKFLRRTLNLLKISTINQVCKIHNIDRKLNHPEKVEEMIKEGISFSNLLKNDIHKEGISLTEKKKATVDLLEKGLNIKKLKGSTLDDKIESLIKHFDTVEKDENVAISIDGYEKMLTELNETLPKLNRQLKNQFELQEDFVLKADFLLDFNIKPRDILDLLKKDDLSKFIKSNGIKQRGDDILNILDHYKDAENLYLENYENIAFRNLNQLKDNGIIVKESELGIKFEELTKLILSKIGFNVNETLKNQINTSKDKIDIILSLDNDDIIIVECKTIKEKGYNKFSSVSRQLKAYQNLAQKNDLRIAKILLVAPDFSDDFVADCEVVMDMNLSLVKASSLSKIFEEFKNSNLEKFPHVLFRDLVINEDRIIRALKKS